MKNTLCLLWIFLSLTCVTTAQNEEPEITIKTFELDISKSIIEWEGSYSFLMTSYEGLVQFSSGELYTSNGKITGGKFIIDMTSVANDKNKKNGNGPIEHLRDEDFFDVNTFKQASLTMTAVEYYEKENIHVISADLTIKGITKSIKFNAEADKDQKTITTAFKIDRTRWGIVYNHDIKNKAISDAVGFKVHLQFK